MRLAFLDTETTSLRPDRRAWEIGVIIREEEEDDVELTWLIDLNDLDLGNADRMSLNIGGFYDRHPQLTGAPGDVVPEETALEQIEAELRGATIVGAVPDFDTSVLGTRMRVRGILPSWHYHLVDVETLAAGSLRRPPPWGFDDLLNRYDLAFLPGERHTALGDARMARALYDVVMAGGPVG